MVIRRAVQQQPPDALSSGLRDDATRALENGEADATAFGRPFLANPDLPYRFAHNIELNAVRPDSLYTQDSAGYTDYPRSS
jgi:N-ethylmaleimide reductase